MNSRPVRCVVIVVAVSSAFVDARATEPGLAVTYYDLIQPDFASLTPYLQGVVPDITFCCGGVFMGSGLSQNVGAVLTGHVIIANAGTYTFFTESDDGSRLFIDDQVVVLNGGAHGMIERSGIVALSAGSHSVRVEYYQYGGGNGLIARWQGPGVPKQVIPAASWGPSGVNVAYYALLPASNYSSLPQFSTLPEYSDSTVPTLNFPSTGGEFANSGLVDDVGAVFSAYLSMTVDGDYTFFTESDDGSRLLVNCVAVVNNDGIHGMAEASGTIHLPAGIHLIRVEYFERSGGAGLIVRYSGPGISKQVIPAEAWSHGDPPPSLSPPLPAAQRAFAGNHAVELQWRNDCMLPTIFDHLAIYRDAVPFASVTGMSPVAVVSDPEATMFLDSTAQNGISYYYAVTAVSPSGSEHTQIQSIGPRTPRDETDLQVVSISRLPRYPRYWPTYTDYQITEPGGFGPYWFSAATGLGGGQTGATQRWPNVSDAITYRATIRNRGTNPINGMIDAEWRVDGTTVASPAISVSLQPRATTTVDLSQIWDGQVHQIRFRISTPDARAANNERAITTKSVAFLSYVDRSYIEDFREETPLFPMAVTDDFVDWLNFHMDRFNELFAVAGTPKRVHFDVLEELDDFDPDPTVATINFAIFPFRYRHGEQTLRTGSGYYSPADDIDYGLLHEMGHQLGLIDLYRLDVPSENNQVSGLGYFGAPACLMNGVSHSLSQHSALAMTHWQETAHGYFGQYLYGIPSQVRMRFIGLDGLPLPGAAVTVYQKCDRPGLGEVITNQAKFQGNTDSDGTYVLPNVNINTALVPLAYNGDSLAPNPYGYVAVVGHNGVLHFKIEYQGFVDYAWLDITECNVAYYTGHTSEATFTRDVHLGGPIVCCVPDDLAEQNAASWSPRADGASASVADDSVQVQVGGASVRFETDGGFDTAMRYAADRLVRWDLTGLQTIRFWCYAENPNIGFQSETPWVRLGSANGHFELRSSSTLLNLSINQWHEFVVPFVGDSEWIRTDFGTPDLSDIEYMELHFDTWGYGFTVWIDGLTLDPRPQVLRGDLDCDHAVTMSDVPRFVSLLLDPNQIDVCTSQSADMNADGAVDGMDVQAFVAVLLGG
ncbi:MAG: PA14 domain-containing protein [Phycisphaerae bacterium]